MKHKLSGRAAASRRWFCRIGAVVAPTAACWLLLVSLPPAAAQDADTYPDVSPEAYYSQAVAALDTKGVFADTSCSEGFCPARPIDRATMAVWTVRVLDGTDPTISETRFDDVDSSSFHAPFIERLAGLEVTTGCGDGSGFCPDRSVTRAEMASFITRAFELPEASAPGFSDVPADAWYADYVARLAASRITVGCGDGTRFCPSQTTTRGEMATFLARATGLVETHSSPPATYKVVSSGAGHACAIRTDGTIACWGSRQAADAPSGTYKTISIGGRHTCAIATDDTITCWGNNHYGEADAPSGTYKAISAGRDHTCAIATDDTITCWGDNGKGLDGFEGPLDAPYGTYKALSAGFFRLKRITLVRSRPTTPSPAGATITTDRVTRPQAPTRPSPPA